MENKKTPITINGKEYVYEDLTQEQQALFNHCVDLDRKIASSQFGLEQLMFGKQAFMAKLEQVLNEPEEATVTQQE